MMNEDWLPKGELNHLWYTLHLLSWLVIVLAIALHILMSVKIGGYPLILSMIMNYGARDKDNPRFWGNNIQSWGKNWQQIIKEEWQKLSTHFKILEIIILLMIISAWLISTFK
jgi:hypothetical protein